MPMTVWREDYFIEVMDGLRRITPQVDHFCLTVTLNARLTARGDAPGSLAFQHIELCVAAFPVPSFDIHLPYDKKPVEQLLGLIFFNIIRNEST